jgi:hypothetical protein
VFSLAVPFVTINVPAAQLSYLDKFISAQTPSIAVKPTQQPIIVDDVPKSSLEQTAPVIIDEPTAQQNIPAVITTKPVQQPIVQSPATDYLPNLLLGIYGIAVLVLLLRFAKNSWHISHLVTKNTIVDYQDTKLVLIDEEVTPHSFLNYVFINKDAYQSGGIEPEIICHEQAHVRQLHSLDVIFVELLQVICWFNPFIPFYRKAIQLNHEFLADEAVIKNYQDAPAYQYLLLEKASQCGSLYLTSQFNYLITKKRLIMMTKSTSAKIALYKKLAMVPLLAAAIFLFSQKGTAQVAKQDKPVAKAVKQDKPKAAAVQSGGILFPPPVGKNASGSGAKKHGPEEMLAMLSHFNGGAKHADNDAPAEVTDAYQAIMKKYDLKLVGGTGKLADVSSADTAQLHKLYSQMSIKQQALQYVKFSGPRKPMSKKPVTDEQLKLFRDTKHGIWIDGKKVENATLANYTANDFAQISGSKVYKNARKKYNHLFQINLTTNGAYENENKRIMADQSEKMQQIHVQKNQLHMNTLPDKKAFKFPEPVVLPNVKQAVTPPLKITGEVLYPGAYMSKREMTAQEWLTMAGGITPNGSIQNVQIFRAGARISTVLVDGTIKNILLPGDSVYVPRIR